AHAASRAAVLRQLGYSTSKRPSGALPAHCRMLRVHDPALRRDAEVLAHPGLKLAADRLGHLTANVAQDLRNEEDIARAGGDGGDARLPPDKVPCQNGGAVGVADLAGRQVQWLGCVQREEV